MSFVAELLYNRELGTLPASMESVHWRTAGSKIAMSNQIVKPAFTGWGFWLKWMIASLGGLLFGFFSLGASGDQFSRHDIPITRSHYWNGCNRYSRRHTSVGRPTATSTADYVVDTGNYRSYGHQWRILRLIQGT